MKIQPSPSHSHLTRREFLKLAGLALGGAALACGKGEQLLQVTGTAPPTPAAPQVEPAVSTPTAAPESHATESPSAGRPPDLVFLNGKIYTVGPAGIVAALAVSGDRVAAIGDTPTIQALAGPETKVIDLKGRFVTPGLIDAHNHLQSWGTLLRDFIPLIIPEIRTLDQLLARVAEEAKTKPAGEWIQGYYWSVDPLPAAENLDPVTPDHPVWLMQMGGHYGSANSKAMQIAGITAETPDPPGGVIARDAAGHPTGVFYNHRAMDLLRIHIPLPTPEQIIAGLGLSEEKMLAVGVTSYHDCNARFNALTAYLEAGRTHQLKMRAQVFYTLEWPADLKRALEEIVPYTDDFMRFAGYKFLIDGQFPTWYTHEPHPGISWDMPTWDPKQFKYAVRQLHDTGLQISVHACGDAAVDLVLDAYEEAMNANPRPDPRHRIEHAILCTKAAVKRAADLGVVISCQPQYVRIAGNVARDLGEERAARIKVTRDWLDAGIVLAMGSDNPTTPWYTPQLTLAGAVGRFGEKNIPFHPEQAMTIDEALYAHTYGSAYAAFEEKVKGSLEPGKFADLVVWSGDFTQAKPLEYLEIEPEMTVVGGREI